MFRVFILLCFCCHFSKAQKTEVILPKLSWDFFKHDKPIDAQNSAVVTSGIYYNYKVVSFNNQKVNFKFDVYVKLDTNKSFMALKEKYKNISLLNHEQGHVNITSIYAIQLKQNFDKTIFITQNYKNKIDEIAKNNLLLMNKCQKLYDLETNHGLNEFEQKRWDLLLKKELTLD